MLGVEAEPWLEIDIQEKRKKIKVRTNSKYSKKVEIIPSMLTGKQMHQRLMLT